MTAVIRASTTWNVRRSALFQPQQPLYLSSPVILDPHNTARSGREFLLHTPQSQGLIVNVKKSKSEAPLDPRKTKIRLVS